MNAGFRGPGDMPEHSIRGEIQASIRLIIVPCNNSDVAGLQLPSTFGHIQGQV